MRHFAEQRKSSDMIPNQSSVRTTAEIHAMMNQQQSKKQIAKQLPREKRQNVKGTCILCRRPEVIIYKAKHKMCAQCHTWCKQYLNKRFGYYNESLLAEAVIAFHKPLPCKFYDYCGQTIPRLTEDGHIRSNRQAICPRCKIIYDAGYRAGVNRIKGRPKEAIRNVQER